MTLLIPACPRWPVPVKNENENFLMIFLLQPHLGISKDKRDELEKRLRKGMNAAEIILTNLEERGVDLRLILSIAAACFNPSGERRVLTDRAGFDRIKKAARVAKNSGCMDGFVKDVEYLEFLEEREAGGRAREWVVFERSLLFQQRPYITAVPFNKRGRPLDIERILGLMMLENLFNASGVTCVMENLVSLYEAFSGRELSPTRMGQLIQEGKKRGMILQWINHLDLYFEGCFPGEKKFWRKLLFSRSVLDGLGSAMAESKGTEDCLDLEKKLAAIKNAIRKQRKEAARDFRELIQCAQSAGEGKPWKRQIKDPTAYKKEFEKRTEMIQGWKGKNKEGRR